MDASQIRLACLIATSVVVHAAALGPFKAATSPSRLPFTPSLTVNLPDRQIANAPQATPPSAVAIPEIAPVVTFEPGSSLPEAAPVPQAAAPQAERPPQNAETGNQPPQQVAVTPKAVSNATALNTASQTRSGVRIAVMDEVSVRVHLLDYAGNQKPKDTEVIEGKTYTYFKSPSLRRTTQPQEDAKPHYPAEKPDYIHGAVILKLLIDEQGALEKAVVVCSNPTFEQSAIASIENMRFTPAQNASGPVKSYMVVEFGYGRGFPCSPVPDLSPSK